MSFLSVGSLAKDIAYGVPSFPAANQQVNAQWFLETHGGSAGNVAAYSARTFGKPCRIVSAVGSDDVGAWLLQYFGRFKLVDVSGVYIASGQRTQTVGLITDRKQARLLFVYYGCLSTLDVEKFVKSIDFKNIHVTHISAWLPTLQFAVLDRATHASPMLSYGPGPSLINNDDIVQFRRFIPIVDFLFLNRQESVRYSGIRTLAGTIDFFRGHGIRTLVITDGEIGSYVVTQSELFFHPAFKTITIDSSGAGDAYASGFLTTILRGGDLLSAANVGSKVGAYVATRQGVREDVPSFRQLNAYVSKLRLRNDMGLFDSKRPVWVGP